MAKTYLVNGIEFRTQQALVEFVRSILRKYPKKDNTLNTADTAFMMGLLQRHPESDTKIGCGVASMYVADNPIYPGERNRCFYLRRHDGTETDFSFWECIRSTPHDKKVVRAMRSAVEIDTFTFKQAAFDAAPDGVLECPDTGERLSFATAHVDHKAPQTFDNLVKQFLETEGLRFTDIAVRETKDNEYQDLLTDEGIHNRWVAYHNQNATLEIVSQTANLSHRKRSKHGVMVDLTK